ncbi:hypothetical protein FQA39_LY08438 [Lamprigera yunnana]|nr:hypothetical protein FQA39_LY08438 [Lamprigera yunnana]
MSATCSNIQTSAEKLQENLSNSIQGDLVVSKQSPIDEKVTINLASFEDIQIDDEPFPNIINNADNRKIGCARWKVYATHFKIAMLVIIWGLSSGVLIAKKTNVQKQYQIRIPKYGIKDYTVPEIPKYGKIQLELEGALLPSYYSHLSTHHLYVWVESLPLNSDSKKLSEMWKVPLVTETLIGAVPKVVQLHEFSLQNFSSANCAVKIRMKTNLESNLSISLTYHLRPKNSDYGAIYGAVVLVGLYILIIFDVIHRTLAAMLGSTLSIAILALLDVRPTLEEIVSWIDIETLLLLFSMMTLVSIFSETGIFDYMAVVAYKLTGGREWHLMNSLCFLTAVLSSFLDNVTTALLMTPVTIRLCEVTKLDPIPVLISMIIYSNIGGAVTPIGDPPNVIIASNPDIIKSGVNFGNFMYHMGGGVILVLFFTYIQLRYVYKNVKDLHCTEPEGILELKREIAVWQRAAACMSTYSIDEEIVKETLKKQSTRLMGKLSTKKRCGTTDVDCYTRNLADLQKKYPIKDKPLLIKSSCIMIFVVTLFFLHSIPEMSSLGLGWTALLGALLLLLVYDRNDIESVFARVEWSTLLFFGSLFILMEALAKLGLIDWIGKQTQNIIMSVEQESKLAVAIILILWVSAIASAFVDNISLTTMMIKIVVILADELDLPLQPLVWALSFGACFGGNGTLLGSSSNIVCAGVAEQHGYRFTFMQFMKIGFPVTITSLVVTTVYLMIVHVVLQWN